MAIQTTRWRPDTCKCVVDYNWDDQTSEDKREHTLSKIEKCEFHKDFSDEAAYTMVGGENINKNIVINRIAVEESIDPAQFEFGFDQDRKLKIILPPELIGKKLEIILKNPDVTII
jgi:hypothetical protein